MTDLPSYGGIRLPSAIGAVVLGVPTTSQTPDSGHRSPVRAVVPSEDRGLVLMGSHSFPGSLGLTTLDPRPSRIPPGDNLVVVSDPGREPRVQHGAQADPIGLGFVRRCPGFLPGHKAILPMGGDSDVDPRGAEILLARITMAAARAALLWSRVLLSWCALLPPCAGMTPLTPL